MSKPQQTAADLMVIALSPILIMGLVGSLCFFLVEVFYQGPMGGMARWILFWFVIAIVLISRIAIENTSEHAGVYGLMLAAVVWMAMLRTSTSFIFNMVLLAIVWFCANKLVWDCTLIDDDEDSSGQGLLQKARSEPEVKTTSKVKRKKRIVSSSPGRWVIYFSLLALPLFGIGQMLLPPDASGSRRWGIAFLVVYMTSALGLLVTTSFLGLRRYLRQRFLKMPVSIALAWVKFGGGIALLIIVGALFVPRPGGNAFWSAVRKQTDYRLHQASEYASGRNPHGEGEGAAGDESGAETGEKRTPSDTGPHEKSQSGTPMPGGGAPAPSRGPVPQNPTGGLEHLLRTGLICAALALVSWWIFRARHVLWEMVCAGWVAVRDFFRRLLDLMPARKAVRPAELEAPRRPVRPLAEFKNPFFAEKGSARPPEEIILYTYEALQAWTREQGTEPRPEQTAREFCEETGGRLPELISPLRQLAFLYAHAAYGEHLPREYDLEPLKEIWRRLTWK
ncbi:MAG TPA: DUF4129 domain-containing protein [Verrucomicrobiae bacterium]|jgi:hypothetical protein